MLISSFCLSEETIILSLKDAVKCAIENSVEAKIARATVESAKQRIYQANSQLLPRVALEAESGYEKKEGIESYWVDLSGERIEVFMTPSSPWRNDLILSLKQRLYSGGEITGKIKQAKIQKEYLEYEEGLVEQKLVFLVTKLYWELKKAILHIEIISKKVEYFNKMREKAKKRLELGSISEMELREAEARLTQAEDTLFQLKAEREYFEGKLANLLNVKGYPKIVPIDEPEIKPLEMDISFAINNALVNNIKLKQQEVTISEKKVALLLAKSARYPKVELSGELNYLGIADAYRKSWDNLKKEDWKIGMNLAYTFYDGNFIQRRIEEENINREIAKDEYEMTKREIIQEIKETFQSIQKIEGRYQRLSKSISLAKENLEISCLQHRMGNITEDEVEKREIELSETETYLMEVKIGREIAKAELNKLMGIKRR